jgi:hypothetical protein
MVRSHVTVTCDKLRPVICNRLPILDVQTLCNIEKMPRPHCLCSSSSPRLLTLFCQELGGVDVPAWSRFYFISVRFGGDHVFLDMQVERNGTLEFCKIYDILEKDNKYEA